MVKKRIIPCLDIARGKVVKGVQFKHVLAIAEPLPLAEFYNQSGADELVIYDITANLEGRVVMSQLIKTIASKLRIPLTVGGGVKTALDVQRLFSDGADKVSINSGALANPQLISEVAALYGSQSIVGSVDVSRCYSTGDPRFDYHIFQRGGQVKTDIKAIDWICQLVALGAGEIVVNTIDQDGVKNGYDIDFLTVVSESVNVPIIASGGAGNPEDFSDLFEKTNISGALAASVFHSGEILIPHLKDYLNSKGIPVRCL